MKECINRDKLSSIDLSDDSVQDIVEKSIRNILVCLGDDPDREGLKGTPNRVYRMYDEMYKGMEYTNDEIAGMYNTCFEDVQTGDLVVVSDIPIFSNCEHHLVLMYNMKVHVGYLPNGKVIGLSKIARIADMVGKRLQLQERMTAQIADALMENLNAKGVMVVAEAEHMCMTMRGIKKPGSKTLTVVTRGKFSEDTALQKMVLDMIKG